MAISNSRCYYGWKQNERVACAMLGWSEIIHSWQIEPTLLTASQFTKRSALHLVDKFSLATLPVAHNKPNMKLRSPNIFINSSIFCNVASSFAYWLQMLSCVLTDKKYSFYTRKRIISIKLFCYLLHWAPDFTCRKIFTLARFLSSHTSLKHVKISSLTPLPDADGYHCSASFETTHLFWTYLYISWNMNSTIRVVSLHLFVSYS